MTIPEFGIKRDNEERRDGGCAVVFDPISHKYAVGKEDNGFLRLFSGGVDQDETIHEAILREVKEESGLHNFAYVEEIAQAFAHFHNRLKNVNRIAKATCLLVILQDTSTLPLKLEAHEKFTLTWVTAKELISNWQSRNQEKDLDHWLYFFDKATKKAKALGYDTTTI